MESMSENWLARGSYQLNQRERGTTTRHGICTGSCMIQETRNMERLRGTNNQDAAGDL